MSTHDYVINNAPCADIRADLNSALAAVATQNSDTIAPTTTYPHMVWADTVNDVLKIRNAANTDWVSVYTLSTGIPIGGGGGSLDLGLNPIMASQQAWNTITKPTIQVATTPYLSGGTSYVTGDVFAYMQLVQSNPRGGIACALKNFTASSSLDIMGHFYKGDVVLLTEDLSFLPSSIVSMSASTALTGATITITGDYIVLDSITLTNDVGIYTTGNPVPVSYVGGVTMSPWDFAGFLSTYPKSYFLPDVVTNLPPGAPIIANSYGGQTTATTKLATQWEYCKGISYFNALPYNNRFIGSTAMIVSNGQTVPFEHLEPYCTTPPLDGNTIYYTNSATHTNTDRFDTSPVDGNTIAIGTYNSAGKTLTVGIA